MTMAVSGINLISLVIQSHSSCTPPGAITPIFSTSTSNNPKLCFLNGTDAVSGDHGHARFIKTVNVEYFFRKYDYFSRNVYYGDQSRRDLNY